MASGERGRTPHVVCRVDTEPEQGIGHATTQHLCMVARTVLVTLLCSSSALVIENDSNYMIF